jgi:diguanylate cyclase (GGDEF)-like protein
MSASGPRGGPARGSACLPSWESATGGFLDTIGLRSIKVKIISFALLATLIPSLSMGWLSYRNNRRAVDEKIAQELTGLTTHAAREMDLWVRERRYDMKILASSYEVTENLEKLGHPGQAASRAEPLRRLRAYLGSVAGRFADYRELFVMDVRGNILASSRTVTRTPENPASWLERARSSESLIGEAVWDKGLQAAVITMAAPIRSAAGDFLGVMGAKVGFAGIDKILTGSTQDPSEEIYLITRKGEVLGSSQRLEAAFLAAKLEETATRKLFGHEQVSYEFQSFRGPLVLGTLRSISELNWGVVAQKHRATAYAAVIHLRNVTLALISAVLLLIGLSAYVLGLTIVQPLGRLSQGAAKVAAGDLEVTLPIYGRSEVGYLTGVFNEMVGRLRKFRDENAAITEELRERNKELSTLSATDGLTGLYNRTRLPELLAKEMARSQRHHHSFTILMADIDHFKHFNDTHGHQAGDEMLRRFAEMLKVSLRSCDFAARYGGEEFLILLTETGPEGASAFAEKLRQSAERLRVKKEWGVTVSIGGASYPEHARDVETLIHLADDVLYRCKRDGRNRVGMAAGPREGMSRVSSG